MSRRDLFFGRIDMKSFIAFALFALLSTASVAAQVRQVPRPIPAPAADATVDQSLSDDDVRSQVHAYLGSIDTPINAARWKVLGPRAEAPLLEVLNGEQLPTRRAKSIDGLSAIGTGHTDLLKTIAGNEQEAFVVRYAAFRALGNLLPERAMLAQLTPVMKSSKDLRVRGASATVIALHSPKSGCAAVRSQLKHEQTADRDQSARAMDACFAK